jgi:hypothetical protein
VLLPSTRPAGSRPYFRLTYKLDGKTILEALPTPAAMQKAEREVEEFRKFQQLAREFLGTNTELCRLRPLDEESDAELKKTIEAIRQEITREVEESLRVVFEDRRKTGRLDVEATEMAMCSALHRAGAAAFSQLVELPQRGRGARKLTLAANEPTTASDVAWARWKFCDLTIYALRPIARRCRTGIENTEFSPRGRTGDYYFAAVTSPNIPSFSCGGHAYR